MIPALALHLLADVVRLRPLEGGLGDGAHLLVLLLHEEQCRLGLRPDEAVGRRRGAASLVDDEGAAPVALA